MEEKNHEIKVVVRTRSGETIKGWVRAHNLKELEQNRPIYLRFANPSNTTATYLYPDQLTGFFIVETFEGKKPNPVTRTFFGLRRTLSPHLTMITGATLVALVSVAGLVSFL